MPSMSEQTNTGSPLQYRMSVSGWVCLLLPILAAIFICKAGVVQMWFKWITAPEYSYGFLVPLISVFLIWQRRDQLQVRRFRGSWAGVLVVALGLGLYILGDLSTATPIVQYAFVMMISGMALAFLGMESFRIVLVPIMLLLFMVPLPAFLYNNLSSQLQLISSYLGVQVIRFFHISVLLEGNVIDLGSYQLQVAEACNGLRYLFPLMTLGFIVACFFRAPFWKRAVLFLSTIPITVLMNSFRIGAIGITVEYWGKAMAEGFLHEFEGWAVFMVCFAILFVEMWALVRITGDRRPFRDVFSLDLPIIPVTPNVQLRRVPVSAWAAMCLVLLAVYPATSLPTRVEQIPTRTDFANFPLHIGEWSGNRDKLERIYLDQLKLDDYVLVNYSDPAKDYVNFYVAYYASQRDGQSAHSPRACIPGGGWRMSDFGQTTIPSVREDGHPLRVNRTLIQYGDQRQLVYYWFQQRGRDITNEYLVKWYLFWDSLTRDRSDGALVRLTTPLREGEAASSADARLAAFAQAAVPKLDKYIPN